MQPTSFSLDRALVVLGAGFEMVRKFGRAAGRKWILLLALTCLPGLLFAQTAPPATYYVATTGSDSNNGTSSTTPFATITHALTLCTGGQTVAVASGTYMPASGSTLTDSKTNRTAMVTVFGWGATQPVIQANITSNPRNFAVNLACNDLTLENLAFRSTSVQVAVAEIANCTNVVLENCDIEDSATNNATYAGITSVLCGSGNTNITIEDCNIHDSGSGICCGAVLSVPANNINIINNTIQNLTGDAMQFGSWNNVTISGNLINNIADPANVYHNDGIQFTGADNNVTITDNVISNVVHGQGMLLQGAYAANTGVVVENNLVYGIGGFAVQNGAAQAVFINNTIIGNGLGGLLLRAGFNGVEPTDTIVANNILQNLGYDPGAAAAFEDYNWCPLNGGSHPTGAHDITNGVSLSFVDAPHGNYHPSPGSVLFGAGINSFSATVDGVLTNFNAPATDLDLIANNNPPTIGCYGTTAGNSAFAYSGFDYSTTGRVNTLTDGPLDFGWNETTWSSINSVVSPGLTYSTLPVVGLALQFGANVGAGRTLNPSDFPSGYGVLGTDSVTRLGAAGTTVWISVLLDPTQADSGNTLTSALNLQGQAAQGTTKLSIGDLGSTGAGNWGISDPATGGGSAISTVPIVQGTPTFLVVEIQFIAGTNNDVVTLWVNPPLGSTPPATPSATLTGHDIQPIGVALFQGSRTSIGDELTVGTSWLSVTSGR